MICEVTVVESFVGNEGVEREDEELLLNKIWFTRKNFQASHIHIHMQVNKLSVLV